MPCVARQSDGGEAARSPFAFLEIEVEAAAQETAETTTEYLVLCSSRTQPSLTDRIDAKVEKRPLLHPAIPSPYAGAAQQKVVYVSSKTPFLSAVKRVEKLLHLADKRLVQSATTNAKNESGHRGKRKHGDRDELLGIAEEVEGLKGGKRRKAGLNGADDAGKREEVVMKGTGKAIHRVLELALWFQQREEEYTVRLRTGSVGAIDDVSLEENEAKDGEHGLGEEAGRDAEAGAEVGDAMEVDGEDEALRQRQEAPTDALGQVDEGQQGGKPEKRKGKRGMEALAADEVPETRIRHTSVLEAAVSLQ